MFRVRYPLLPSFQRLQWFHSGTARASTLTRPLHSTPGRSVAVVTTATTVLLWYLSNNLVHNDAPHTLSSKASITPSKRANSTGINEDGELCTVVWGSNKSSLISPRAPGTETFLTPVNVKWLENTALRDMALHEKHAACVDVRGDVFQWGDGFFGSNSDSKSPKATLRGKNVVSVQLTDSCVYALSASGRVYVFAADEERQKPVKQQTAFLTPGWVGGWLGREQQDIDFIEIFPKDKLNWGETFVSITAGANHLLALTSGGRTYAHPINKGANSHGQLGLHEIEIPTPSGLSGATDRSRMTVELVPQSTVGPNANLSSSARGSPLSDDYADTFNDRRIGYSDSLFEIPSLRGIKVSQIAAGGRSSFVNTSSGRVLGWGANEHGQIGLGSGITLEAITVPTEINLNRNVPASTRSRCLSIVAGGDLTYFVAERDAEGSSTYVDILSCGNGQWGGLGNGSFSTFQGNPVRVKNISGLREFDDQQQRLSPITPYTISISPIGHVLLTLDTQLHAGPGGSGRDLVAWGLNQDYQLGTGKRSSLNTPTTLERPEGGRFILTRRKATVKDLSGKVCKKGVEVEQSAVAGYNNSVVYWKVKP